MKILFFSHLLNSTSSCVINDLRILSDRFNVQTHYAHKGETYPCYLARLFNAVRLVDLCYIWFGGWHAYWGTLFCRLLGKKSVLIPGGFDVADIPSIRYGYKYASGWKGRFHFAVKYADIVIPVSEYCRLSLEREFRRYDAPVIYNGVDIARYRAAQIKKPLVLTVAFLNEKNIRIKGLEQFIAAARLCPDLNFVLAGDGPEVIRARLRNAAPSNLQIVKGEEIVSLYARAKIYVQASIIESFGMSLAEAMLCECIPVVTDRGAIPEVAGQNAIYVEYADVRDLVRGIKKALDMRDGTVYRERVIQRFSLEKRKRKIMGLLDEMFKGSPMRSDQGLKNIP